MCEYITSDLPHQPSALSKGVSSYLFRAKSHAPEGQGSLISEWSDWSPESSLVYDTKSQSAICEILDTESGEIQSLTVKKNGKKVAKKRA